MCMQDTDGSAALHYAATSGQLAITELLLPAGADTSLVEGNGNTAFDVAVIMTSYHDDLIMIPTFEQPLV